ncbi:MAG: aldehyde dehydrogenase [Desulfurococcales archaeon]|nr:aldehyde dehydrogenase [Desulfurococcales archaeon]
MKDDNAIVKIANKFSWMFGEYRDLPDLGYYLGAKWEWIGPLKMHYTNPYTGHVSYVYSIPRLGSIIDAVKSHRALYTSVLPKLTDRLDFLKNLASSIERYEEELAIAISLSTGKPIREARHEVSSSIELLENSYILLEAYGRYWRPIMSRTLIIGNPSNGASLIMPSSRSPILTTIFGLVYSISLGSNLLIFKPPSRAPLPTTLIAGVLIENGFKNVIVTSPVPGPVIVDILASSMLISSIFAAGATSTMEDVDRKASGLYRLLWSSDLSASIICDDVDVEKAARAVLESRLAGCGDLCLNTHVIFTPEELLSIIEEKLIHLASNENPGDPLSHATTLGPLIEEERESLMESLIDDALSHGARLLHGRRLKTALYQPYILGNIKKSSKMLWQRTVVPLLGVVPVKSCREAISIAESIPYVKALLLYTEKYHRFLEILRNTKMNLVYINTFEINRINHYEECINIYTSPLIDSSGVNRVLKNIIIGDEEEREPEAYR